MKFGQMVGAAVLGVAGMAGGCTSQSATKQPMSDGAPAIKAVTPFNIDASRLYTLADYPELTPEEMGRRILALIASVNAVGDGRVERFREVMGVPIAPRPERDGHYAFLMSLPESGWVYGLNFETSPARKGWSIDYGFTNEVNGEIDDRADMSPVCGMDAMAFDVALRGMGFKVSREYDGLGRLFGFNYESTGKPLRVELLLRPKIYTKTQAVQTPCVDALLITGP